MTSIRALFRLTRREIAECVSSHRLRVVAVIALFVTPLGASANARQFLGRQSYYLNDVAQRRLDRQAGQHLVTGVQADPSLRVIRPPTPAAALVRGRDLALPTGWEMSPEGPRAGRTADAIIDIRVDRAALDLEYIVRIVLGLLAILLGVETLGKDRVTGTIRLLLGQPIPPWTLIGAKLLGGAVTLATVLVVVTVVGALAAAASASTVALTTFLVSAGSVIGPGLLYLILLFAIGVVIAALIRSHHTALVTAAIVWLVWALTLTSLSPIAGETQTGGAGFNYESRKGNEYQARMRAIQERLGAELRARIGAADLRQARFEGEIRAALDAQWSQEIGALRAVLNDMDARSRAVEQRRLAIERWIDVINPAAQFARSTAELAGTGDSAVERWRDAVDDYARALRRELFDDERPRLTLRVPDDPGGVTQQITAFDRRKIPTVNELSDFQPPLTSFGERLQNATWPGLLLVLQCAAAVITAGWLFLKRAASW
jgi:hypothetical protein